MTDNYKRLGELINEFYDLRSPAMPSELINSITALKNWYDDPNKTSSETIICSKEVYNDLKTCGKTLLNGADILLEFETESDHEKDDTFHSFYVVYVNAILEK